MTSPASSWTDVGDRVRTSRLASGLTQADLAGRVGLQRSMISKIEAGEREVDALELYQLADALGVPLVHLISRPAPSMVSRREALEDTAGDTDRLRYRLDALLEEHARRVGWLVEQDALTPPPASQQSASTLEEARRAARSVRAALEVGDAPLGPMGGVAEQLGLYLTVVDLAVDGASMSVDAWGVAVVGGGSSIEPGRRRMTAAHELGHHVLGDEYSSDVGVSASRDEREAAIQAFAAELLLPGTVVAARLTPAKDDDTRHAALVALAAEYRVSWAVAVRIAGASGLTAADIRRLRTQPPVDADFLRVVGVLPSPDLPLGDTGPEYRRAVLRALDAGRMTSARAHELLYGVVSLDALES